MGQAPRVVARAILRSAAGERPGIDVPIAAVHVARLAPTAEAVEAVARHFRAAGFDILGKPAATVGIAGPKELFESCFGVELVLRADQAYGVRGARPSGQAFDPTQVPADALPQHIRRLISQIALEASVALDQQPERRSEQEPGTDA